MDSTQQKIAEAVAALTAELESARRERTFSIVVGSALFLMVFFGFMLAARKIQRSFGPEAFAELQAYTIRQTIEEQRPVAEKAFWDHIPVFLKNLRRHLVNGLIPLLRSEIERELVRVVEGTFLQSSRAFAEVVRAAIERVKSEADRQGMPPPDALAALIRQEFERETEKRYTDTPRETLGPQFEQSRAMLGRLNRTLHLPSGQQTPASREEALDRKFIRAWVGLVSEEARMNDGKIEYVPNAVTGESVPSPPATSVKGRAFP